MNSQNTCRFKRKYHNYSKKKDDTVVCHDPAIKSGYCKLHDSDYLNEQTKLDVEQLFMAKVNDAIKTKSDLLCIGYNLPTINVSASRFTENVYFNETTFNGVTQFERNEFLKDAIFERCEFIDNVSFTYSKFHNTTNFNESFFKREVLFLSVKFLGKIEFVFSKFDKGSFSLSNFHEAEFIQCHFIQDTDFKLSKFNRNVIFQQCNFENFADFSESMFGDEAIFANNSFTKQAKFRKLKFTNEELISFYGDLSTISFLETNVSKIHFGDDVIWEKQYSEQKNIIDKLKVYLNKLKDFNRKFVVQDEQIIEVKSEYGIRLETVLNIYRNLRENFDKKMRYDDAGQFFIREMELKRKFKKKISNSSSKLLTEQKNPFLRIFSVLGFYYLVGKYGESYYRPLKIIIPGLLFSMLYFWSLGFSNFNLIYESQFGDLAMNKSIIRTISAFFPFYGFGTHLALSDLLLRIALLPLMGALFIALRRKLERKFR